jgi:small subunit ribosomal protein S6
MFLLYYTPVMNTYELTILLPEDKDGKEKARILKVVTDFAKKAKGEINKQESWGAKHMAYLIKKQAIAEYEHFVLSLPSASQPELDKTLRMDESILRYMFIRV